MAELSDTEILPKPRRSRLKPAVIVLLAIVAAAVGVSLLLLGFRQGPVPRSIQKQVNFRIYYPAQDKLPAGYKLNGNSFRTAESNVVLFSVSYGSSRSMAFSETAKPPSDVIDKFNASAIPVHTQVSTTFGKALIGAYGSGKDLRTIASLPINNGPWLIVTAPSDINQTDLQKVLQAITR